MMGSQLDKLFGILGVLLFSSVALADPVEVGGSDVTIRSAPERLWLKSTSGVKFELSFLHTELAATGAESAESADNVVVKAVSGASPFAKISMHFTTTCTRIYPVRGQPFTNQVSAVIPFSIKPPNFPTALMALPNGRPILLAKNVHGGEEHRCQVNLSFNVDGNDQVDPINGTTSFHPQFAFPE